MGQSRHTVIEYISDEKIHGVINQSMCRCLVYINDQLHDADCPVRRITQRKDNSSAKLRLINVYYNFFDKYFDVAKVEELEMVKESLYGA